jgi:hypothetical protein
VMWIRKLKNIPLVPHPLVELIRNPARDGGVFERISRESVRAEFTGPSHGKSMCSMGKMHEQGPHSRRSSPCLR